MRRLFASVVLLLLALDCAANPFAYSWQQLSPSVWAGIRSDPFELPQEGNAVIVLTSAGAVLFDAGGSPAMGEAIVAKVRTLTDHGVTDVVISHWHGDHMRGLQSIVAAFPSARVIAHADAREWIVKTREKWLKRRVGMVPGIRRAVASALAGGKDLSGRPLTKPERAWLEAGLGITEMLDAENRRTEYVIPDSAISDSLTLFRGGTEIRILHPGKAHTSGDLILWLPDEKIVAAGDIVTAPVPLMPSPYTASYRHVLQQLVALDFSALVPGHGAVQHDASYLALLGETIDSVGKQVHAAVAAGLDRDKAVTAVDFSGVENRFTHGDAFLAHRFDDYVRKALPAAAYSTEVSGAPEETF